MDNLKSGVLEARERVWKLAHDALEQRKMEAYQTLVEVAERLTSLTGPAENHEVVKSSSSTTLIFRRYKGTRYEAEFDKARVNGGRGQCVQYQGEWLTPSNAAVRITRTAVNGWRFWKYEKPDGRLGLLDELR